MQGASKVHTSSDLDSRRIRSTTKGLSPRQKLNGHKGGSTERGKDAQRISSQHEGTQHGQQPTNTSKYHKSKLDSQLAVETRDPPEHMLKDSIACKGNAFDTLAPAKAAMYLCLFVGMAKYPLNPGYHKEKQNKTKGIVCSVDPQRTYAYSGNYKQLVKDSNKPIITIAKNKSMHRMPGQGLRPTIQITASAQHVQGESITLEQSALPLKTCTLQNAQSLHLY